jgi:GNAT superfamily N-acetyltransferase
MGIVDLRGRADDPGVVALAALIPTRPGEAGGAAAAPRLLVGWSVDDELVAGVGIERSGAREIELHSLFVLDGFRRRGIGRSLVDAVVSGSPVERFRVVCGPDAAGFFERCGFVRTEGGALVRDVVPEAAAPDAVSAITLTELEAAIRAAWGRDTSADPDEWTTGNPARGQCDATAVLVRSYLGGEILVADVLRGGRRLERHAWNRLASGLTLDVTRDQFRAGDELGSPAVQEPILLGDAPARHALLAERVAATLALPRSSSR